MDIPSKKLLVLVEDRTGRPSAGPVPLPTKSDVLYEPSTQPLVSLRARAPYDGTRPLGTPTRPTGSVGKRCDNCRLWAEREERCLLMGRDVEVLASNVCGYHVAGDPQLYVTALSGEGTLAPELAGLIEAPSRGTTCDGCSYYDPRGADVGLCRAVAGDDGRAARVDALGCCARWRAKADVELPKQPPLEE